MKKILFRLMLLALVGAGAWYAYKYVQGMPARQQQVATSRVRKGDVTIRTYSRGELRAVRSVTLTAPNLFGTVQVTNMAALGALAREKDLVIEFDDSELLSRIEEKQLELDQIDEQTKKARADLNIRNNQDQVELLRTRYSVRRAELEVKRNELLSQIDAKKNQLNLEESKRRLTQLESDIKSRLEQAEAELAVLNERRNKSVLELQREKNRLLQVKLLSPITGLVAVRQNRSSGFFVPGMSIPDIREGDQVQPGMPVADVLDLSELEVVSRVGELDRANLKEGQDVLMRLDAIAGQPLNGKIKAMSGTATSSVFSNDPAKKFDVVFSIDMKQLLTTLGASPQQIDKIMATAVANSKKPVSPNPFMMGGAGGGGPEAMAAMAAAGGGGGGRGGRGGGGGGGEGGPRTLGFSPGGPGGQGGGGGAGGSGMTDEMRTKMREAMRAASGGKNPAEMSEAERAEFQKKMTAELKKAGVQLPAGMNPAAMMGGGRGGRGGGGGGQGGAGGEGGGGRRGGRGGEGGGGGGGFGGGFGATQFTQKDLDAAKLPPPPEEDSQLDVLLRPGMLADVEIIVEKIPNAVHVPTQAIFEHDNKPYVYIKGAKGFEERPVMISRRTESTVVIGSGLQEGETVAMANPFAKPGKKGKAEPKSSGGAMGALPSGGSK